VLYQHVVERGPEPAPTCCNLRKSPCQQLKCVCVASRAVSLISRRFRLRLQQRLRRRQRLRPAAEAEAAAAAAAASLPPAAARACA
jgi:hypothetical protein